MPAIIPKTTDRIPAPITRDGGPWQRCRLACSSGFANGDGAVGCVWISECRDEACFVAVQRGQESWDFLESPGRASLGSVACLYRRRATEPTIWCNAKGQPATCQVSRPRAWSPWPLGRPGSITRVTRASTWLTASDGGRLMPPCSWSTRAVICSQRSLSNCLLACDSLPQEALGSPVRLRALDARSAGHRRRRRRRAKHSSQSC